MRFSMSRTVTPGTWRKEPRELAGGKREPPKGLCVQCANKQKTRIADRGLRNGEPQFRAYPEFEIQASNEERSSDENQTICPFHNRARWKAALQQSLGCNWTSTTEERYFDRSQLPGSHSSAIS